MSIQLFADETRPVGVGSSLSKLIDEWALRLKPVDFKIAVRIYRMIEQNGGCDVPLLTGELAKAVNVSERSVQTARKTLVANGIIRLEINSGGSWYGFPEPPATTSKPELASTKSDDHDAPEIIATQDGCPASVSVVDIQVATDTASDAETLFPVHTGSPSPVIGKVLHDGGVPDPAIAADVNLSASNAILGSTRIAKPEGGPEIIAPAADATSLLAEGSANTADAEVAPEIIAPAHLERGSAATAPAIIAGCTIERRAPGSATIAPAANAASLVAEGSAKNAEPYVEAEMIAEAAEKSHRPPVHPGRLTAEARDTGFSSAVAQTRTTIPASLEDKIAAAVQRLTGFQPSAADVRRLRDSVNDLTRLLRCLEWMESRGERYTDANLLYSQVQYYYWQRDGLYPSPFIDDERRAEQKVGRRPK
jgi:predicted DNA-binding transcriptional regulator